jgi:putative PIN family toxin of toxin-antitoxin system
VVDALFRRNAFELVLSPALIAEIETALRRPKIRRYFLRPKEALLWLEDLVTIADLVRDTGDVAGVSRDPADDVILAAAIEGRANVIVTGDEDLLILEEHQGVAIVTPRRFLNTIEG